MKKLLFISLVSILLSCSKTNDLVPEQPKIEFSIYSSTKTYTEISAGAQAVTGGRVYSFVATKSPASENSLTISFQTDSLAPGSYNLNTGVFTYREGSTVVTNNAGSLNVTITSNVNGLVNGTFSGTLFDHTAQSSCSITSGIIQDVQLSYR